MITPRAAEVNGTRTKLSGRVEQTRVGCDGSCSNVALVENVDTWETITFRSAGYNVALVVGANIALSKVGRRSLAKDEVGRALDEGLAKVLTR